MATGKLVLDLALVLPGIPDEQDACVARLASLLRDKGIDPAHIVRVDGAARLCLHYDPERFGILEIRRLALAAGASLADRYAHESLRVYGMDCSTCADVIEHALSRLDGVLEAKVSYAAERLRVEYDTERTSRAALVRRLETLGYRVADKEAHGGWRAQHRELVFGLASGALLLIGWLGSLAGAPSAVSLGLYLFENYLTS